MDASVSWRMMLGRVACVGVLLTGMFGLVAPAVAQVDAAFDAGEAWLLSRQVADGSLGDLAELAPRDTSVTVLALKGRDGATAALDQALVYLSTVPEANAEFRSQRALAFDAHGDSPSVVLASIGEFRNGGGMGAFVGHQSSLLDTAFVVQALSLDESTYQLDIVELLDYLQAHQDADGGWGFAVTAPSETYYSAETLHALAGLRQLSIGESVLNAAAAFLLSHQQADGGFDSILDTAVAYRALLTLGRSEADFPHGSPVPYLLAQQAADGSWEASVFTTAQVLRVLRAQSPNLTLTDLVVAPSSVLAGGLAQVTATVRNLGPLDAVASHLALRRDAVDGELLQEIAVPALAAGESSELIFNVDTANVDTAGFSGAVDLYVLADSQEEIDESSEDDNSDFVRLTLRGGADLALFANDLSVDPLRPEPDQNFQVLIHARNLGESEVASFGWRVMRLVAGAPTDTLASGTAGPVVAGGAVPIAVTLNLPEGEHSVEVQLDADGLVDEENEDNNLSSLSFFVVDPAQPDLAVLDADVTLTPAEPSPGDSVQLDVTVRNLGQRPASSELVIYQNDPSDGGVALQRLPVSLNGGAAQSLQATLTVGAVAHSFTLVVDEPGEILELDESNNFLQRYFRQLPDLAIGYDNLELLPAAPLDGDLVAVTVTVRNAGTAAASNVTVHLYDGDPAAGGVLVDSGSLVSLAAGANGRLDLQWAASGGRNELLAVVDPDGLIVELSESNNRTRRTVAVPRGSGPDLRVDGVDLASLSEDAVTLEVGGSVEVSLSNGGDGDVDAPFVVRLFADLDGNRVLDPGDTVLGSAVYGGGLTIGATATVSVEVNGFVPFHRALSWAEVDATDVVAEQREGNNHRALFSDCALPSVPTVSTEPFLEWSRRGLNVETVPLVAQLSDDNGDGLIDSRDVGDIVVQASDAGGNGIFALSGLDGSSLWTFRSSPANPLVDHLAQAALADLDGDGRVEILGHQTNGRLVALEHDGRLKWVSDTVPGVGGRSLGGPAIGDLDGDGVPEIAFGRTVLDASGHRLAVGTGNGGENWNYYGPFGVVKVPGVNSYPQSLIADVDLDGRNELVAGDTLYRLEAGVLEIVWNQTVPDHLMRDGWNAVGNLDGDPYGEIVYVSSGQIMVLNHDGSTHAGRRTMVNFIPFQMPTFWGGAPTIADLDGDGSAEILVSTATQLIAYRGNLSSLWRKPIPEDFGGITGVTAFDLDGDGVREVLFNGEKDLYVLDGRNGATLHTFSNLSFTAMEHPAVADVDGDGRAEIILPSNRDRFGSTATQGLHVLGNPSWQGSRPMWNQYSYHVTNIGLDGTVPSPQTPPWQLHNGFRGNLPTTAPVAYLPNLTVSLPRVGEATDGGVPVTLRVGNGGREPLPAGLLVELYDGVPGSVPAVGSGVTTEGLRPGAYLDLEILWQGASDGTVTAHAMVDPGDAVVECDEADNSILFDLTATVLPDLAIAAGGVTAPASVPVGGLVPVQVVVENLGIAAAPASLLRLYEGDPSTGLPLADWIVEPLAAGQSRSVEVTWETLGRAPGIYPLHVVLDADGELLESDESNNRGLTQVELTGAVLPDLAALDLTATPSTVTAGGVVQLTARLVNRGADLEGSFEAAFVVNSAEVGRVTSLTDLASGEERTLTFDLDTSALVGVQPLAVRLDPANAVAEGDEGNNQANATLTVDASPLRLRLSTDRRSYTADQEVQVSVLASNDGTAPLDGVLSLTVLDSVGSTVAQIFSGPLSLPLGDTTLPAVWNTGSTLAGTYSVVGSLQVDGAVGASGSVLFSIAGQVEASASLFSDRDVYTPLQSAVFTGAVRNLGSNQALAGLTARLTVRGPSLGGDVGASVFGADFGIAQLLPGASRPVTALWEIGNAAGGTYLASLELLDDAGLMIAYADTPLTVEDSATTGSGLSGQLMVTPELVGAGAPLLADAQVQNDGNADMPGLHLRIDMRRLVDGELVASFSRAQPLDRDTLAHVAFGLPTAGLSEEDYLISLVGILPGGERRLDAQAVTVARGISIADATVLEGDGGSSEAQFAVSLSSPSSDAVTVDFATADGTAIAGEDYQATAGTLTFAPGETLKAVAVTIYGDLLPEPNETYLVTLSNAVGVESGDSQGLGGIVDEEGCAGPNLMRGGDAEEASLNAWTQIDVTDGNGWGQRFADPVPLAGIAAFGYGGMNPQVEMQQTVDLSAYGTRIDGGGQGFAFAGYVHSAVSEPQDTGRLIVDYLDDDDVVLDSFDSGELTTGGLWQPVSDERMAPLGTRRARLRLLITDQDGDSQIRAYFDQLELRSLGVPVLTVLPPSFQEGDSGTPHAEVQLVLSCPAPTAATVSYLTADLPPAEPDAPLGSAVAGLDYLAASGDVVLGVGETSAVVPLQLLADDLDEADERFELQLSSADDLVVLTPQVEVLIADDDGPVVLAADPVAASEGAGSVEVTLRLSAISGRQVTVAWATVDGGATAGSDYQTASGSAVFPPGTTEQTVTLQLLDDGVHEPDESFALALSAAVHATLGQSEVEVAVLDDDPVTISVSDAPQVDEGDSGTVEAVFTVSLSVPSVLPVTLDYATLEAPAGSDAATSGVDFQAVSGGLTFAPGTTSLSVAVPVLGDLEREPSEIFLLQLSNPSVGSLLDPQGVGTIFDDDGILISVGDRVVTEGPGNLSLLPTTVVRSSSQYSASWPPTRAVDNNLNTSWFTASGDNANSGNAPWIEVEMAADSTVTQIRMFGNREFANGHDFFSGIFQIFDVDGNVIFDSGDVPLPAPTRDLVVEVPELPNARRVRFTSTADESVDPGLAEFHVMGTTPLTTSVTVSLSKAATFPVAVDYQTVDGSAHQGSDYLAASGSLSFDPGVTEIEVPLQIIGDSYGEPLEVFYLQLSNPVESQILDGEGEIAILDTEIWRLLGDGSITTAPTGCVQLTLDASNRKGAAWRYAPIDLAENFDKTFQVYVGSRDGGSDGLVFTLQNQGLDALGGHGGALGNYPISPAFGVEVDTYDNGNYDLTEDHISFLLNGVYWQPLITPVQASPTAANVEDGQRHPMRVVWNAQAQQMDVQFEGEHRTFYDGDLVSDVFAGSSEVLYGFTGGNGYANEHYFCEQHLCADGSTPQLSVGSGYLVEGDGTGSAILSIPVTLSCPATETVSVDYATADLSAEAGSDYDATSGNLSFAPGETSAWIEVTVHADDVAEPDESFSVELSNLQGGVADGVSLWYASGQGNILTDDVVWHLNSSANETARPGCIQLTPDGGIRAGSAWRSERIDLRKHFDMTFDVYVGTRDGNGADGLVFALQNLASTTVGGAGNGMGWAGISPAVGVELDTYDNGSFDPSADHLAVDINGSISNGSATAVQASPSSANVEDGQRHAMRLIWNADTKTLDVHFEGDERLLYTRDIVAEVFSGNHEVWWGFTGGNWAPNEHYFCPTRECYGTALNPSLSVGDVELLEGNGGSSFALFPVTLHCPSAQPVSVRVEAVSGTAIAGEDFAPTVQTLTFQPGETHKTFSVEVFGDLDAEPTEVFSAQLSQPSGGQVRYQQGLGTIISDDIRISLRPSELIEGTGGTIVQRVTVVLSDPTPTAVTLQYSTADGTALAGQDYLAASGSVSIAANASTATFDLRLVGDGLEEDDETFFVDFTAPAGSRVASGRVDMLIEDDDDCPGPNLLVNGSTELDPTTNGWTQVSGLWRRAQRRGALDGDWYFWSGFEAAGELFQEVDISSFAPRVDLGLQRFMFEGFTRTDQESVTDPGRIVVEYRDANGQVLEAYDSGLILSTDTWHRLADLRLAPPGSRTIRVSLFTLRYTGTNNDASFDALSLRPLEWPTFAVVDASVMEGESGQRQVDVLVQQSCVSSVATTVDYLTADGSALAGSDYLARAGTLVLQPGETSVVVQLTVLGDTVSEDDELFYLDLVNSRNAGIARGRGEITILQDEVLLVPGNLAVTEGNSGTVDAVFSLTLSAPSTLPISVDYYTGGGNASSSMAATENVDYIATTGTVTFQPGETVKTVTVQVLGDLEVEADETFRLNLDNPVNVTLSDTRGYADILDDDVDVSIADVNVQEGDSGTVVAVFPVTLSKAVSNSVTVQWTTADGTATAGLDYQASSGSLTFQAGEILKEIRVNVLGDTELENSETFSVFLTAASNGFLADDEGIGLIIDDDDCPGPNLLLNPSFETLVGNEIADWTEIVGDAWQTSTGGGGRSPVLGSRFAFAGAVDHGELRQDIDLTPYQAFIDDGLQRFSFQGFVATANGHDDPARLVVDYLDGGGAVLDSFDSGEIDDPSSWRAVADLRLAPVGTRSAAVRLLSRRLKAAGNADAYFDNLSFRSVGTPVMSVQDLEIPEGDTSSVFADFDIQLTCGSEKLMHLDYQTVDGSAEAADDDYLAVQGTLTFAIGESQQTLSIEIPGDFKNELLETFTVEFGNEVQMVLLDRVAEGAIRDADPGAAPVPGVFAVYTLDDQFDTGSLVSLHHDTPLNDQLQLVENGSTFPFIWIALSDFGTIVKIDVETGKVLGEYSTSPDNRGSDPSRTTVALDGSVWVGNRGGQSVTHVGLPELNQCVDRNGNGFIDTSVGLGNILLWPNADGSDTNGGVTTAQDECILHHVRTSSSGTRHISVTKDNDIWVSGTGNRVFNLIDGQTGTIVRTESGFSCGGYGGLIDGNGIIWSVTSGGSVLRWDPDVQPPTAESKRCIGGLAPYGIAIDSEGWIWISSFGGNQVRKVSPDGNTVLGPFGHGTNGAQGLAVDGNDDVWISNNLYSNQTLIGHVKGDGTYVGTVTDTCRSSTGMAVDANGKIWAACYSDGKAARIDPTGGPIGADGITPVGATDLVVDLRGSHPYNYSDMTGAVALRATAPQGSFSAIQDSGIEGAEWGNVRWNTEPEAFVPEGGSITVEVRASDTVPGLGGTPWITIDSGVSFEIYGRYLQVRATLRPAADGTSPVLSDLRIGVIDDAMVTLGDGVVEEGDPGDGRQIVFPVTFSEPTVLDTTFTYTTVDGSALADEDYLAASGTLTIPAGQTTAEIVIDIVSDEVQESDEGFSVVLSDPFNAIFIDGDGAGTILDDDIPALSVTKTDTLSLDRAGDGDVSPGDQVTYEVVVSNVGSGLATGIVLDDTIPTHTTLVAGSVTTTQGSINSEDPLAVSLGDLLPGSSATVRFSVRVDDPFPTELDQIANQAAVTSVELPQLLSDDPDTPEPADPTVTPVVGLPELTATKTDTLLVDADGDGAASPGDTLRYTLTSSNVGDGAASGVVLGDLIPDHTAIVPGSVTSDTGTVLTEDPVHVDLGLLAAGQTATVRFDVLIDTPLPVGVDQLSNQATLDSDQLPTVLSDDPDVVGEADPTVTPLVTTPLLEATKTAALTDDLDADGEVNPGDGLSYEIVVHSDGNTGATAVTLTDLVPEHTTLVAGSVTTSVGSAAVIPDGGAHGETVIEVGLGTLEAGETATVTFQVRIADPLPAGVEIVVNQALIASSELDDVLSDDPSTPEVDDPTVTPVVVPGQTTVCEAVPFDQTDVTWTFSLLGDADQGEAVIVDERLHLSGDGTSLYHGLDNGAFYHHAVGSDADVRLEVSVTDFPVDAGGEVRKAALMLRTGLDPLAARVMVTYVPHLPGANPGDPETTGLQFDARLADGTNAVEIGNTVFGVPSSTRLAIEKKGDVATVYYSLDDGATWTQGIDATYHGSATIDWAASGETLLAGVMVASYDAAVATTAEFADFEVCRPDTEPPFEPPTPPTCDAEQPLDVIVLLDTSGSMTASFPGTGSKLEAAKLALDRLVVELSSAPAGSRLGLVTASGFRTPEENLAAAYEVLSPLTTDMASVNALAQAIDGSLIDPGVPTPAALALKGVIDGALPQFDDAHQPVLVWLSDGIANIDILGRGPEPYELEEVQAISLYGADGQFLSWGEVGWSGDFNPSLGTFDGEPLANAMFQLERLGRRQPELLIYGVAIQGDGVDLGTFNPDLLEYAAHVGSGRAFAADDTASLVASIVALSDDAQCEMGTASLGGRLWNDRDGDGLQSPDSGPAGEPGLPAVSVDLFDDAGFGVTSTQTNGAGAYVFGQLPAGTYSVQVDATTLPTGDHGLPIDVATYDLDGIATVDTATTTVTDGEVRGDVSFGYMEQEAAPPAQICEADTFDDGVLDSVWQWVEIGDADQGAVAEDIVTEGVGNLLITSDGSSLFHGTDNGTLVYRHENGDFRAQVRVAAIPVDEGGPVRKGCLTVRSGSGDADPRVMVCYIPHLPNTTTQALQFDVRHGDGTAEEMADFVINAVLPVEMAIVRQGDLLTVEYSLDGGLTWVQPDGLLGGEVTLDLGPSPLLGMIVASYDGEVTMTMAFDDFEICRPNPELP